MVIYLDHAATTPLAPQVLECMMPYLTEHYANPSSLHRPGQKARRAVEAAREEIAEALNAKSKEIIFTSGATEAANQVLSGLAKKQPKGHILSSKLEHAAVYKTCESLKAQGYDISYVEANAQGIIEAQAVKQALKDNTICVALMAVNNETGIKTDIAKIATLIRETQALFFCDAVQAFGFEPVDVQAWDVDFLSISGHKIYGPKGIGALFVKEGLELPPLIIGGQQERGYRAGTHNTAAIVGLGAAASKSQPNQELSLANLRDNFEHALLAIPGTRINGQHAPRGPKHSNVYFPTIDGEALLMTLDALGIYASAGSACAAGSLEPSHVLMNLGLSPQEAKSSIRFSLGKGVNQIMLEEAVDKIKEAVTRCQL